MKHCHRQEELVGRWMGLGLNCLSTSVLEETYLLCDI